MGFDAGFAPAMNRAIAASTGELVLVLDSDVFLEPGYVPAMIEFFETHERAGCAGGKLLRFDMERRVPTNVIDTAGVRLGRNRRLIGRGEGSIDDGRFELEEQVFGVDGAGLVARRGALESIQIDGEYFDPAFFMHKEDADLCWRLRLAGWEIWYVPSAIGSHGRTTRSLGEQSYLASIADAHRAEKAKYQFVRVHAMKNQWLMLAKNEDGYNFVRDLPFIVGRELMVFTYNLFFAPRTLVAVKHFAKAYSSALAKRRVIKRRQQIAPREFRRWLTSR
jgi:GT2 family glycosyltransferase